VKSKLPTDPLTQELCAFGDQRDLGRVVDLGCGRGQYALLLFELGKTTSILGFDHDASKIEAAQQASGDLAECQFMVADLKTAKWGHADTVLLLDVLHYLPHPAQASLLEAAATSLRPGGHLLLRETNGQGWGARWARGFERCGRALGINRGDPLCFTKPEDLKAILEKLGLSVTPFQGKGLLNNVLLTARRN
jgi:2-polyprenyl-3-methyl-5-hydroxy-6-metoxy-1,4-benzoquinol methylase